MNKKLLKFNDIRVGVVGNGYVGQATSFLGRDKFHDFPLLSHSSIEGSNRNIEVWVFDKLKEKCDPEGMKFSHLNKCHIIFVCVPTPMNSDGSCATSLVEDVINRLKVEAEGVPVFVRSTVPVGFCDRNGVNFMPEFLTEKNWVNDVINAKDWVIGLMDDDNLDIKEKIRNFLSLAHRTGPLNNAPIIHFAPNKVVELSKYVRNCFLATKVSFFNGIEKFCGVNDVSYEFVRELVCLDERVGESHTEVPGPDGKHGFGGTCFPKDLNSLIYQMEQSNVDPMILSAANDQNNKVDRPERDWEDDRGRAVSF